MVSTVGLPNSPASYFFQNSSGEIFCPLMSAKLFDGLHVSNDINPVSDVLWRKD